VSDESRQLLNKEDLKTRLDDLVHNHHMTQFHQSAAFNNPQRRKDSEKKISDVLKFFAQSEEIKTFLVEDLLKRGKETLDNIAKEWT
jgi:hypothetical protein